MGADKHFPKPPCVEKAWDKLAVEDGLVDKTTEELFAAWLKNTDEGNKPEGAQLQFWDQTAPSACSQHNS